MLQTTHVVGIDPGLVHTGAVSLNFDPVHRSITLQHEAIPGPNAARAMVWINEKTYGPKPHIFIEDYRQRSAFNTDKRMIEAVQMFRRITKGKALDNMGVKKVVKRELMEVLGCWSWPTPTHHQDLRSAARIAIFGMLKDEQLNAVVTAVVRDYLDNMAWTIHHV